MSLKDNIEFAIEYYNNSIIGCDKVEKKYDDSGYEYFDFISVGPLLYRLSYNKDKGVFVFYSQDD
jgi:hypothetical protein